MNDNPSPSIESHPLIYDYKNYLLSNGIKQHSQSTFYLQVGKPNEKQGWIIYISIWKNHFPQIIDELIQYFIRNKLFFKIPLTAEIHHMLNQSNFGNSNQGKIIIIYTHENTDCSKLLKDLIQFTQGMRGTNVPDAINIGHLIYTKYESYEDSDYKTIIDPLGNRISDQDINPSQIYDWFKWPFPQINPSPKIKNQKIINDRYFIKSVIKNDAKGFIFKALYQKNIFIYKTCIIKEGRMGMLEDDYCRDIEDRLKWQFQLHNKLSNHINIPRAISFFKEDNNHYLSIEFINGVSLGTFLGNIFNGNQWFDLKLKDKLIILNILIKAISIINTLHKKGYVHRDLNTENFIVTKNHDVWLIDLELTYDLENNLPMPPFDTGTEGFMSPEQSLKQCPTIEQDIYSIGSLILMSLTLFNPYRLNRENKGILRTNLAFFFHDKIMTELIISCFDTEPLNRPPISKITEALVDFKSRIIEKQEFNIDSLLNIDRKYLNQLITDAISTLENPIMTDPNRIWTSPVSPREDTIGNIRFDRTIFIGFRKGISGILYFLSEAKNLGIDVRSCANVFEINWKYLKSFVINPENNIPLDLYSGRAGIAVTINEMIKSSLIDNNEENIKLITECLNKLPSTIDISSGVAGFGFALLKCYSTLSESFVKNKIKNCIEQIIKHQLPNGAWLSDSVNYSSYISTGFDQGISGIIYFLLAYVELFDDNNIKAKAIYALNFLKSSAKKFNKSYAWPEFIGLPGICNFSTGDYLILRPFIKAYKITNNISYKIFTEKILRAYPNHVIADWISQEGGLAGLGEIYLDAWIVFNNEEWFERAKWIANVLIHNIYGIGENTYWIHEIPHSSHADLLTGNSGVIRFLIRFLFSDKKLPHILDLQ